MFKAALPLGIQKLMGLGAPAGDDRELVVSYMTKLLTSSCREVRIIVLLHPKLRIVLIMDPGRYQNEIDNDSGL